MMCGRVVVSGELRSLRTHNSVEGAERLAESLELDDPTFVARLEAATDAEPRAVEELVREFQPNLTAYARSRRFPDPDGVVNETLSDGLQNLPSFRGRDRRAFRAYLYRILRRRIVDEYRRSARQPDTVAGFPNDLEAKLIDASSSSFDESIVAESTVDEILANLTIEQREVLEMRVLTGLSIKETADLTGRSEAAVKAMHRRALRSLRTVLIAAALLILGILGVRLLLGIGGEVSLIDNSPAGDPERSFGIDPPPAVPVVEVDVVDDAAANPADQNDSSAEESTPPEPLGEIPASGADQASDPADVPFIAVGSSSTASDSGAPAGGSGAELGATPGPAAEALTGTPCEVIGDARPRSGEVAFVVFNFSGPYDFLNLTSIDIQGKDASALFPGTTRTDSVKDGRMFPIVLDPSMFDEDDALTVTATLANGEISVPCANSERVLAPPCFVTVGEDPQVGDVAQIAFKAVGPWAMLRKKQVHPVAPGRTSAFAEEATIGLVEKGPHDFTLAENMLGSRKPWVTIAILGPADDETAKPPFGRAVCEIS